MPTASSLRVQIEAALAHRIPAALSPAPRSLRPVASTGIGSVDALLEGGLPLGGLSEIVGQESSGRTSLALAFVAGMTGAGKVCAWVDVSNAFDPECAAAAGVDLERLLWVRCGVPDPHTVTGPSQPEFELPERYFVPPPVTKGLHGGGFGPHPRDEGRGIPEALGGLLPPGCAEPAIAHRRLAGERALAAPPPPSPLHLSSTSRSSRPSRCDGGPVVCARPWSRIEQALRVTDLLLQAGGFGAVVLDMAGIAPEYALRVPLATWFRYRAAAERTQASVLLLSQHACTKSSAALVLRLAAGTPLDEESTVFAGIQHRVEVSRQRSTQAAGNVVAIVAMRRPVQRATGAEWRSCTTWSMQWTDAEADRLATRETGRAAKSEKGRPATQEGRTAGRRGGRR
jgi:recombination protein RecA